MIDKARVQQILTETQRYDLLPHAQLVTDIANIYLKDSESFGFCFENGLREIAIDRLNLPQGTAPSVVRNRFVAWFSKNYYSNTGNLCHQQAMASPAAGPEFPGALQVPSPMVVKLYKMRTPLWRRRGWDLADAAMKLSGEFRWKASGPQTLPDKDRTDFVKWFQHEIPVLGPTSSMNCWEVVMYSAHRAGLLTLEKIEAMYRDLANHNPHAYYEVLGRELGISDSAVFSPSDGLVPEKGDLIYWWPDHVAISLGQRWVKGIPEVRIMSLWHNNNKTFINITTEDFPPHMHNKFRFRTCPF